MSDEFSPLDLKFLPDWLKEGPSTHKYSQHPGEGSDRPRREGGPRGGARGATGGPGGPRDRDRRPDGNRGRPGGGEGERGRPFGDRRGGSDPRRGDAPRGGRPHHTRDERDARGPAQTRPEPPPSFKLEFLPEPTAAGHIAKQIRQSARAYPLLGTARMFLEKPERHQVRVISTEPGRLLYQLEEGPICFDKSWLERSAFTLLKDRFYREESRDIDGPKGNYTSVARCRSTGTLLGPTNHHAYQVAIRKLYEERFSRRMSFMEFQRGEIEVLASEQAVADWKAQVSKVTVYFTTTEAEPIEFKNLQEAEAHFSQSYLPQLIRSGNNLVCSGKAAREFPERFLSNAAREAFDKELAYPGSIVHGLRHQFAEQNLHVFKHRKRVVYVSGIRPTPATTSYQFAEGPATLLTVIGEHPRINKRDLAAKILGIVGPQKPAAVQAKPPTEIAPEISTSSETTAATEDTPESSAAKPDSSHTGDSTEQTSPELDARKKQLAADLHYLVHAGHVIEFADGKLDLPLLPVQTAGKGAAAGEPADGNLAGDEPTESIDASTALAPELETSTASSAPAKSDTSGDALDDSISGHTEENAGQS